MELAVLIMLALAFIIGVNVGRTDCKRSEKGEDEAKQDYSEDWKQYRALHEERFKDAHKAWKSKPRRS